jgi:hypothetical protein
VTALEQAAADADARLDEYVQRLVADAPPVNGEQLGRLRGLMRRTPAALPAKGRDGG